MSDWIPCKERIPEWGVSVIVAWAGREGCSACEAFVDQDGNWSDGEHGPFNPPPSHWMPMPEPPDA